MRPRRARARLAALAAASVALVMAVQAVLPALPALQDEFGITNEGTGLFTLVYVLPGVLLTIPLSSIGDRTSPRTVLAVSLIAYGAAGAAQGLVATYEEMLALRFLQGICFAAAMPLTLSLTAEILAGSGQLKALSARQTAITIGEFTMPLLGAGLAAWSWQSPLLVQALVIPVGLWFFWLFEPGQGKHGAEHSPSGRLIHVVLRQPGAVVVMLLSFARFLFKFCFIAYVPILLVEHGGASVAEAGVIVALAAGVTALTASRVAYLIRRVRPSRLAAGAAVLVGVSLVALGLSGDWRIALLTGIVFGAGDGALTVMQDAYVTRLWPARLRAGAAAVNQTARNVGKLAAPLAMTLLIVIGTLPLAFVAMGIVAVAMSPAFASLRHHDDRFDDEPSPPPAPWSAPVGSS